ncbi:MAG TPA: MFS transporter [Candidatus Acidoferrales bacterium]|nr:MFS transporter [Candidatus Acidoferrales bacterium]
MILQPPDNASTADGAIGQPGWKNPLAFDRNITAASLSVLTLGLGEELWKKFLPKYLELLGATAGIIGLFGAAEDFLDAIYQYPGGWLADRFGRRAALLTFLAAASAGYLVYFWSPSWPFLFLGLALTMVWQSMASPAIFATIADALPKGQRARGFTLQSLLKRVPMVISPVVGGAIMGAVGLRAGFRTGLAITLGFALITLPLLASIRLAATPSHSFGLVHVWSSFHRNLKRLLISDIAIRICEGMADIFTILYATNVAGISVPQFGVLVAIQLATSIAIYLPAASLVRRVGAKPVVAATFFFFAAYPLAVILAHDFGWMVFAFVVGGLREIGEPARKAMIVDFADAQMRARSVGLYYLIRGLSITPASLIGGLLWKIRPEIPFLIAGVIGLAGMIIFLSTVPGHGD